MIDWPEGMTADRRARFVLMRRFYWIRFDGNDEFLRGETKKKKTKRGRGRRRPLMESTASRRC